MATRIRLAGSGAIVGGLLWSACIALEHRFSYMHNSDGAGYYMVTALATLACIGFLVAVQGLAWSRATGAGRFGRRSLRAFQAGLLLLILGGIGILITRSDESALYPLGALVIIVAGVSTGVAVMRAEVLSGWRRFTPLLVSLYFLFGMVIPIAATPGDSGAPAPLEFTWGITWVVLGLAFVLPSRRESTAPQTRELTASRA